MPIQKENKCLVYFGTARIGDVSTRFVKQISTSVKIVIRLPIHVLSLLPKQR